jgi:hypothetical protein
MPSVICDVCRREPVVGVCYSALRAATFTYCAECCRLGAEPCEAAVAWVCEMGGLGNFSPRFADTPVWKGGKYIPLREALESEAP